MISSSSISSATSHMDISLPRSGCFCPCPQGCGKVSLKPTASLFSQHNTSRDRGGKKQWVAVTDGKMIFWVAGKNMASITTKSLMLYETTTQTGGTQLQELLTKPGLRYLKANQSQKPLPDPFHSKPAPSPAQALLPARRTWPGMEPRISAAHRTC